MISLRVLWIAILLFGVVPIDSRIPEWIEEGFNEGSSAETEPLDSYDRLSDTETTVAVSSVVVDRKLHSDHEHTRPSRTKPRTKQKRKKQKNYKRHKVIIQSQPSSSSKWKSSRVQDSSTSSKDFPSSFVNSPTLSPKLPSSSQHTYYSKKRNSSNDVKEEDTIFENRVNRKRRKKEKRFKAKESQNHNHIALDEYQRKQGWHAHAHEHEHDTISIQKYSEDGTPIIEDIADETGDGGAGSSTWYTVNDKNVHEFPADTHHFHYHCHEPPRKPSSSKYYKGSKYLKRKRKYYYEEEEEEEDTHCGSLNGGTGSGSGSGSGSGTGSSSSSWSGSGNESSGSSGEGSNGAGWGGQGRPGNANKKNWNNNNSNNSLKQSNSKDPNGNSGTGSSEEGTISGPGDGNENSGTGSSEEGTISGPGDGNENSGTGSSEEGTISGPGDGNENSLIDDEEERIFETIDKNDNGLIDDEEERASGAVDENGNSLIDDEEGRVFGATDKNGNGSIDDEEGLISGAVDENENGLIDDVEERIFEVTDKNGNGLIDDEEERVSGVVDENSNSLIDDEEGEDDDYDYYADDYVYVRETSTPTMSPLEEIRTESPTSAPTTEPTIYPTREQILVTMDDEFRSPSSDADDGTIEQEDDWGETEEISLTQAPTDFPTLSNYKPETAQQTFTANLGRYPGSTWPIKLSGQINIIFDQDVDENGIPIPVLDETVNERILVELVEVRGLTKNCEACKIKIHKGKNCRTLEALGTPFQEGEKWYDGNAQYYSDENGVSNSQFFLNKGLNYEADTGYAIALYTQDDKGIACGLLRYGATTRIALHMEAEMGKKPFVSPFNPYGKVRLFFNEKDNKYRLIGDMHGLDPDCLEEQNHNCRIKIQGGRSCEDKNGVGGVFGIAAESNGEGKFGVVVETDKFGHALFTGIAENGFNMYQHTERVVIVYGKQRNRIACGVLRKERNYDDEKHLLAYIKRPRQYKGILNPEGLAQIQHYTNGTISLSLDVAGLDTKCSKGCKVAIQTGRDCHIRFLGQPLWKKEISEEDIWDEYGIYKTVDGQTYAEITIPRGAETFGEHMGKTVVFYNSVGTPVGCGTLASRNRIITKPKLEAKMGLFPHYDGVWRPEGIIRVTYQDQFTFNVTMDMTRLEHTCENCLVAIMSGMSCDDPFKVGGFYYHPWKFKQTGNPWTAPDSNTVYTTSGGATGVLKTDFQFQNGYDYGDNVGHAIVAFGKNGEPISCGILRAQESSIIENTLKAKMRPHDQAEIGQFQFPSGRLTMEFLNDGRAVFSGLINGGAKNCVECKMSVRKFNSCDGFIGDAVNGVDWNTIGSYTSDENGNTQFDFVFDGLNDLDHWDFMTKIFILHDQNGRVTTCGKLMPGRELYEAHKLIGKVEENLGKTKPYGLVTFFLEETEKNVKRLFFKFDLGNLKIQSCGPGKWCRITLNTGKSCEFPGNIKLAGFVQWQSDAEGFVDFDGLRFIEDLNIEDLDGRALIMYGEDNNPKNAAACVVLRRTNAIITPEDFNKALAEQELRLAEADQARYRYR